MWCLQVAPVYFLCCSLTAPVLAASQSDGRQAGTVLAPCGPELRALGSNFSTETTED